MGVVLLSLPYFGVNSTDCSGEFPVVFEHFQNLEDLLNILKELSCGLFFLKKAQSIQNSTKQTAVIKFDINFIFKSTGRTLVPVKELSKATFCHQKKQKKQSRQVLHESFFNLQYKCAELPIFPVSKSLLYFLLLLFFKEYINPLVDQDQQNGKPTYCELPPLVLQN